MAIGDRFLSVVILYCFFGLDLKRKMSKYGTFSPFWDGADSPSLFLFFLLELFDVFVVEVRFVTFFFATYKASKDGIPVQFLRCETGKGETKGKQTQHAREEKERGLT